MKILFAADDQPYTEDAIPQLARLGENTWADITLLGLSKTTTDMEPTLRRYQEKFLSLCDPKLSPYTRHNTESDGKKKIVLRTGKGNPAGSILEAAQQASADLITLGTSSKADYAWLNAGDVPLKVAKDASISVLVIKEDKKINKMLCCLDHDNISQKSLEMIKQILTLNQADLEIVVLTGNENIDTKIENKLSWLLKYFTDQDILPQFELVKLADLEKFVSRQARWGLMAMWMGKKSILEKVFPSNKLSRLLKANDSSVLLLR